MTRWDDVLGWVRLCPGCGEEWPDDREFYRGRGKCRACASETKRPPLSADDRRARDRERKAAIRRDPIRGDELRAKERVRALRYYHARRRAA